MPHIQSGEESLVSQDAQKRGRLTWAWDHLIEKRVDWRSKRGGRRAGWCRACWEQESWSLQPSPPPLFKATIMLPTWPCQTKATGNTTAVGLGFGKLKQQLCKGEAGSGRAAWLSLKVKPGLTARQRPPVGCSERGWPGGSLPGCSGAAVGKSPDFSPPSLPPQHLLWRTSLPSVNTPAICNFASRSVSRPPRSGMWRWTGCSTFIYIFQPWKRTRHQYWSVVFSFQTGGDEMSRLWRGRGCATASPSLKRSPRHRLALWCCQHRAWWALYTGGPSELPHHPELVFLPLALGYRVQHPSTWTGQEEVSQL